MSDQTLFSETSTGEGQPSSSNAASNSSMTVESVYLKELVGESKKFKSIDDLARGKLEADAFIEQLKQETAALKEELKRRAVVDEVRQSLSPDSYHAPTSVSSSQPEPQDFKGMIEKVLQEKDVETRKQMNKKEIEGTLLQAFGSQEAAKKAIQDKADELGVSTNFLIDAGFVSPKVLYNNLGINTEALKRKQMQTGNVPLNSTTMNSAAFSASNEAIMEDAEFEQLRSEMRKNSSAFFANRAKAARWNELLQSRL